MPRYYFDVKDGYRFVDPSGATFKNDHSLFQTDSLVVAGAACVRRRGVLVVRKKFRKVVVSEQHHAME
jgi:hypothetical protein